MPGTCDYVTLHGRGELSLQMGRSLLNSRQGIILDYLCSYQISPSLPKLSFSSKLDVYPLSHKLTMGLLIVSSLRTSDDKITLWG